MSKLQIAIRGIGGNTQMESGYELQTQDGRKVVLVEGTADRTGHPLLIVDIYDAAGQRQSTFKLNYNMVHLLWLAFGSTHERMLDRMCDY